MYDLSNAIPSGNFAFCAIILPEIPVEIPEIPERVMILVSVSISIISYSNVPEGEIGIS